MQHIPGDDVIYTNYRCQQTQTGGSRKPLYPLLSLLSHVGRGTASAQLLQVIERYNIGLSR